MIDGAANLFGNLMESLFSSNKGSQSSDRMEEEKRWQAVDDVDEKYMSLYRCLGTYSMGVYYLNPVSSAVLERCFKKIQEQPRGAEIAHNLLEPFQSHQTGNMRSAWLNPVTMSRFFNTLNNQEVATVEAGNVVTPQQKEKLQTARIIFVRTLIDSHWYLTVITRIRPAIYSIQVLDSFNNTLQHEALAEQAKGLLSHIHNGNSVRIHNEGQHSSLIPTQDGHIDDGVAIAYYAHKIQQGESLDAYAEFNAFRCDYVQFRMYMAFEIAARPVPEPVIHFTSSPTVLTSYPTKVKAAANKRQQSVATEADSRRSRASIKVH
ncbi:MAG: hypothetical protein AB7I18_03500 [Candidatus Berkiella sp.]